MKSIKILLLLLATTLLVGCATATKVAFEPQGSRDEEKCIESNNCIIKTDNGEAILSISNNSAVTLNFVNEDASQSEGAENKFYDYLVTISNTSENEIDFDPKDINGYDPEKEVAALKSSSSNSGLFTGLALGAVALGGYYGGADGAQAILTSVTPAITQMFEAEQLNQEYIFQKENEFSEQKLPAGSIAPEGVIAGRIILDAEKVAKDLGDTKQHKITVSIPVGSDKHSFSFIKEILPK